jgi:hypothetical protein
MKLVIGALAPPAVEEDWIVCLGETRSVIDGMIACPLRGRSVPVGLCGDCHLLTWRHDEREARPSCSTESFEIR